MNIIMILLTISALVVPTLSWGDDNRRDGNWWLAQDKLAKLNYMTGFFEGMELGHMFTYWKYAHDDDTRDPDCTRKSAESYFEYKKKYFSNTSNIQLSDGLDSFYADYKNRRIPLQGAVWLIVNGIFGTPQEELNTMIESWRRNSGN